MMSRFIAAGAVMAALALPSIALAEDANVQRQLQEMQQRMQQMEDKLQATNDQLDSANQRVEEQSQLIEGAGLTETRGATNGLPGFLGEITIGGWVASSYFYNLNDPQDHDNGGLGGTNSGLNGRYYPLHPDHNSFALDQAWWEIEKPISEEARGGFRFDVAYGKTAAQLGGPNNRGSNDDSAFYIAQGYVQYLAPIGDGVTFKMGKFSTPIGVEVPQTVYNWNITRSAVWALLQPVDHIGITAGYKFGDSGFDAMIGGVNGFTADDPDVNDAKSVLGHVGWTGDKASASLNGIWGGETVGNDGNQTGLIDAIVKFNPTERLAMWVNGDYRWFDQHDQAAWGVEAAARFAITEATGISVRGEYVADVDQALAFCGLANGSSRDMCANSSLYGTAATGVSLWGLTATLDHLLTDHLMVRGEVRYDTITKDNASDREFFNNSSNDGPSLNSDQIVVGVEAIYNFNKFGGE